jgi:hypothetical protein
MHTLQLSKLVYALHSVVDLSGVLIVSKLVQLLQSWSLVVTRDEADIHRYSLRVRPWRPN